METQTLHELLETEKTSALLANFAQTFQDAVNICLIDVQGRVIGYHPDTAPKLSSEQLRQIIEKVQRFDRLTTTAIGLAAPVRLRGQLAGALVIHPHADAAEPTLRLLARLFSLLAENSLTQKALLQETVDRYREINLLYRVGDIIAASLDLPKVNRLILNESTRLIKAEEGAVMLADRDSGQLTVWASCGLDAVEDIGTGIPLGHEPAQQVFQTGKTEIFEHPPLGRRKKSLAALLCVPLKTKDEVLGVISLAHTNSQHDFRANDIKLLNALAGQAAIAIDNARMFSDLSALHTELETANRRLLELDKLKSSFLGVITHELRSPFANIDFCRQLIERYGTETWSDAQQEQWSQLTRLVQEAKGMIDNLVSFAALLSKQGDLYVTETDFAVLVQQVIGTLTPVAQARQITLQLDKPPAMPPLMADKMRLAEAIYHLIHNAIKFSQQGDTVNVRYWLQGPKMIFEVQDNGIGIPEDKLEMLGDPFSQMADPLRRGVEGLGLGLALIHYVVHAHGGKLDITSQEGIGSTFRFWVPRAGPQSMTASLATTAHNKPSSPASAARSPEPVPAEALYDRAGSIRADRTPAP